MIWVSIITGLFILFLGLSMDYLKRWGFHTVVFLLNVWLILSIVMWCFKSYVVRVHENLQETVISIDRRMDGE